MMNKNDRYKVLMGLLPTYSHRLGVVLTI
jgi:hypothetical protein